ncbi:MULTISPECIES: hypothetical protein [Rhodococcus]|uniref:Uncharacterized protein n=1 Tax=Rhodococcus oxybenzonivorans TaxID=1990687 RepID=A0AAE4V2N6_9NOCA|nr:MULTISPECIES: hypothetical protein [Rhodococcus]MDV7240971.1 hypothetical protein [Rhodococcus oxybenzonivorans]MDV7266941.1 hypothetical protein [Rhodococcus oxybenzonivorans]MDV7273244.1 hypothetical protein [Rhodococcus oxybenzonivorans]MDV7333018.1 hypothetical protein [Rhodococcus oxybenzonivorans]MDV7342184.1 hypothetical protein [Rhodococcus oxybenzonivorans]
MRYRVAVVAPNVVDVVRLAGGWLFDQAMAGWDVSAIVADHSDARPLQILGAITLDLESALASPHGPCPQVIAVSADLYQTDSRVRRGVLDNLDEGQTEVLLLGDSFPDDLDERFGAGSHRLSMAARAFKAHALAAATVSVDSIGATETFRHNELLNWPSWSISDIA